MDQPGDEGAVARQWVDAPVQWADLVGVQIGVGRGVGIADRLRAERDVGADHLVEPGVRAASRVQDADDRTPPGQVLLLAPVGRRTDVRDRLPAAAAGNAVRRDRVARGSDRVGLVERVRLVEGVGLVERRHGEHVVEADPEERLGLEPGTGLLQQHPAVGCDGRFVRLHGEPQPGDAELVAVREPVAAEPALAPPLPGPDPNRPEGPVDMDLPVQSVGDLTQHAQDLVAVAERRHDQPRPDVHGRARVDAGYADRRRRVEQPALDAL